MEGDHAARRRSEGTPDIIDVTDLALRHRTVHNAAVLALAIALGSLAAEVSWTDHSGRCPASEGRVAIESAAEAFSSARVSVEIDAAPEGLTATLRLETADGIDTRTLQSPSCGTLVEAAALITEAAARANVPPPPAAAPEEPPAPVEETVAPEPVPEPPPRPATAPSGPAPEPPPSPALSPTLRASGFATYEITPRWSGGAALGVGLAGEHWHAEATGSFIAPSRTAQTPGVRVWGWSGGLRACGTLGPYTAGIPLEPALCASAEAGQLFGRSTGETVVNRSPHVGTWAAAAIGPSLRAFVRARVAIVLDAEAVAVLYRPGFALDEVPVFQSAIVAPRVSLGLLLRFGGR